MRKLRYEQVIERYGARISKDAGISARRFRSIASGKRPTKKEQSSLWNAHRRREYKELRTSGISRIEAKKAYSQSIETVDSYLSIRKSSGITHTEAIDIVKKPQDYSEKYQMLRRSGSSIIQAEGFSELPLLEVKEISKSMKDIAKEIAKENGASLRHVLKGMRKSDRTIDDWEDYVKARRGQNWIPIYWSKKDRDYKVCAPDSKRFIQWQRRQHDSA